MLTTLKADVTQYIGQLQTGHIYYIVIIDM